MPFNFPAYFTATSIALHLWFKLLRLVNSKALVETNRD